MSSEPPSRHGWEELLNDKDVVVLTKANFFKTVNLLFHYAEDPERRTWEFFHYRGWEYILGTWCATFSIEGFAVSCGAQHPFIHRLLRGMHYALPDYVLMSHSRDVDGEQEDRLFLVVEIKALGPVDPDTQAGRETAENIFQKTWQQRQNQARLAFRNHPSQDTVHIVMASGPWFAPYMFRRSKLLPNEASDEASSYSYRPQRKRPRRGLVPSVEETVAEDEAQEGAEDVEDAGLGDKYGERRAAVSRDSGKRKRGAKLAPDLEEPMADINHVFQLGPSGERNALNPWFLQLLEQMKDELQAFRGEFKTQNSWFDCPTGIKPTGDGHAEGFVLPTTAGPVLDVEDMDIGHVTRLDEDPALFNFPSTPGNDSETLNMMQLNAMLSPTIRRASRTLRGGDDTPFIDSNSRHGSGPLPLQPSGAQSVDSAAGDDITPKGQRGRQAQGSFSQSTARELSPSESRLERRQHGPLHPPQFYSVLPDSSPLRFTPKKQLFGDRMADEDDSELLAGYDPSDPESEAFARPASTSPAPSSSSSNFLLHDTMYEDVPSGSNQPPLSDRVQQDHTDILPGTSMAPPSHRIPPSSRKVLVQYVPAPEFHTVPPSRRMTKRMDDPAASTGFRLTATPEEWHRNGPTDSELWVIAMRASKQGVKDCEQAFRNAGMPEKMAHIATRRHYDVNLKRIRGSSSSSSRGNYNTAALAAPPLHPQRHRTRDSRDANPHPSQLHHSSVATVPQPPTSGGDGASRSRPPRASGSGARTTDRTASRNDSHSESSSSDFPDGAPEPAPLGLPNDAQMNRLAEGVGNLDVTNVPGRAGNPGRGGGLSQDGLHGSDRLPIERRMQMFYDRGMDDQQAEEAHERYAKLWKTNLDDPAQFHPFLRFDAAASRRTAATSAAPVQRHRSALAGSDAHPLPQPSDEETPGETDVSLALLGSSVEQGQSRTNTSRKGKEKQR